MGRKQLILTDQYPYHVTARANNCEWFYLPKALCWHIFLDLLIEVNARFGFQTHAFVLMDNHYHLIGTASQQVPIPRVMEWFQRAANRRINDRAGRINHLFGGPYKPSLIQTPEYFFHAYKYVYQNPVAAGLVTKVQDYAFSSLVDGRVPLTWPITGIEALVPKLPDQQLTYLNSKYDEAEMAALRLALKKTTFEFSSRMGRDLKERLKLC